MSRAAGALASPAQRAPRPLKGTDDYEPFGVEITPTDECDNTHKFTGHERDVETGNDYMHFRFFSASMGRFQKPDSNFDTPGANPQGWNLYSYVKGNPVNFNDPTGHQAALQRKPWRPQVPAWGPSQKAESRMFGDDGGNPSGGIDAEGPEGSGTIGGANPDRLYVPEFDAKTGALAWRDTNANDKWAVNAKGKVTITNMFNKLGGAGYVKDVLTAAKRNDIQLRSDGVVEVMAQHMLERGWSNPSTKWNYGNIKNAIDTNGNRKIGAYDNREAGLDAYFDLMYRHYTEAAIFLQNDRLNPLEFGVALRDPDHWYAWAEDRLYAAKLSNIMAGQVVSLQCTGQ